MKIISKPMKMYIATNKLSLLVAIALVIPIYLFGQNPGIDVRYLIGRKSQIKEFADSCGHYEIAANFQKDEFYSGDTFKVSIYFTGYGKIGGQKVFVTFPEDIIEYDESYVLLDFDSSRLFRYGGTKYKLIDYNVNANAFSHAGVKMSEWDKGTFFFDVDNDPTDNVIATEMKLGGYAPLEYYFIFKEKPEPGKYNVNFYFTYFNGREWDGSKQTVEFKVPNIIQRNEVFAWLIAIVAGVAALEPIFISVSKFKNRVVGIYKKVSRSSRRQ